MIKRSKAKDKHELWDVYDAEKRATGKTIYRDAEWPAWTYHLVIHICLLDEEGRMLIQKRSDEKVLFPGCWDMTIAGNALAGETSQQAAMREAREELGLLFDLEGRRPDMTIDFKEGFDDIYVVRLGIDRVGVVGDEEPLTGASELGRLPLQREEVTEVKWADRDEVMAKLAAEEFLPYSPGFLAYLFEMRPVGGFLID